MILYLILHWQLFLIKQTKCNFNAFDKFRHGFIQGNSVIFLYAVPYQKLTCRKQRNRLFSDLSMIFIKRNFPGNRFIPYFWCKSWPFFEFGDGHFLFHISCIMSFICTVICLPNRVIFALAIISASGTDITAGFGWVIFQFSGTIIKIFSALN